MRDPQGRFVLDWQDMERVFNNYFKELFNTTRPSQNNIAKCTKLVEKKVTPTSKEKLQQPFTSEEVHEALKQMGPLKSPRPDRIHTFTKLIGTLFE